MERLTFDGLFCDIAMCSGTPGGSFCEDGTCSQRRVWERLKAYEDTGLDPEELRSNADINMARVVELLRADAEGRLVVMPCKFGDTIYRIRRFKRGKNWTKEAVHIFTTTLSMNNVADILFNGVMGKTVFLTREEAEAALKEGKHHAVT